MSDDLATIRYRLDDMAKDIDRHEASLAAGREGFMAMRQDVALIRQALEAAATAEREREKVRTARENARDARVKRLTAACVSVAVTVTAGSIGTIVTFIVTRGGN